jgi:predicted DCC family thiol-disulfide oxidoreductase YuxK
MGSATRRYRLIARLRGPVGPISGHGDFEDFLAIPEDPLRVRAGRIRPATIARVEPTTERPITKSPTVFYDSDCGFCVWCVAQVIALDRSRKFRYRAIQDPRSAGPLSVVLSDQRLRSWHFVASDGTVHSAGHAFAPLLRELPLGRPVAAGLELIPAALLDRAYYAVAARRSRAGALLTRRARRRSRASVRRRTA